MSAAKYSAMQQSKLSTEALFLNHTHSLQCTGIFLYSTSPFVEINYQNLNLSSAILITQSFLAMLFATLCIKVTSICKKIKIKIKNSCK